MRVKTDTNSKTWVRRPVSGTQLFGSRRDFSKSIINVSSNDIAMYILNNITLELLYYLFIYLGTRIIILCNTLQAKNNKNKNK